MPRYYPHCYATISVVFDEFNDGDGKPQIVQTPLRSASVHLNNYKEADTFAIDFDARELPIHPDLISNAAVQVWMFQTDGLDFNPHDYAVRENMIVAGLIDRPNTRYSGDGRSVHMEGRDYTALLIGKAWDPTRRLPVGDSLADVVQKLVDEASGVQLGKARVLTVDFIGEQLTDDTEPALGVQSKTITHKTVTIKPPKTGAGRGKSKKRGIPAPHADSTYWDVIYRLCLHHGFICFVQLDKVIITNPQTLSSSSREDVLQVAYGRNLEFLEVDRSMGKEAVPQIIAASYDPKARQTIEARWPDKKSSASAAKLGATTKGKFTGIGTKKDEELRVDAPFGITDKKLLQTFARNYYQTLARGESKTTFATAYLTDLAGLDMLRVRPGKPVLIGFDPFNDSELITLSPATRAERLVEMGYEKGIARLIADNFDKLKQFRRPYRVREITFEYSNDDGIKIDVEANQYVFVERDDT